MHEKLYAQLLRLHPRRQRADFGAEMAAVKKENAMYRRILIRTLVVCLLLAGAVVTIAAASYSKGAEVYAETPEVRAIALPHRLRTAAEHDAIMGPIWPKPYVLELPRLVFYGAHHTSDRSDPQFVDIERRWSALEPTVALCEGRSRGMFIGPIFTRLAGKSEVQLVHELARRDGVRLLSLEPRYDDEVAALLKRWSPEQVALYFTMRVYWSEAGGRADEDLALDLLRKRTNADGLRGSIDTIADLDRVWQRETRGTQGDWRSRANEPDTGYWPEITTDSRRIRGEHMARTLLDLHRKGERVFAVVGSGHVVRLEWILRAALGAPPAKDQPRG